MSFISDRTGMISFGGCLQGLPTEGPLSRDQPQFSFPSLPSTLACHPTPGPEELGAPSALVAQSKVHLCVTGRSTFTWGDCRLVLPEGDLASLGSP